MTRNSFMKKKMPPRVTAIKNIIATTLNNAVKHDLPLHGAAIAFYTIFSIAPLFIIILSLSQFLLSEELVQQKLFEMMSDFLGSSMAGSIQTLIETYGSAPTNIIAYVIAIATIVFGATTVITQLKSSLNTIWEAEQKEYHVVYQYLIDRLLSMVLIIIITVLFVGVLFIEAISPLIINFFDYVLPEFMEPILTFGLPVSSFFMALLFFYILFRLLPDVQVPKKDVLIGALTTAVLFLFGKFLVGWYLGNASVQVAYRAAGSFVVFLIWTYYNIQIILLGAEFTHAYSQHGSGTLSS